VGVPKRHLKAVDGSGFDPQPDPWEQRFRLLAGSVRALVSVHDAAGSFLFASPLVSELTGVPRDTLLGSPVQALIHPEDSERVMALHRGWMRGPGAERVEYRVLAAGGGWCPVETTFVAADGPEVQWVTRRMDVVGAEPQTAAEIDPATGLPTRFSLLDRLAWALHPAGCGAAGVVVIRIDGLERIVEDRGRPGTSVVLRELGRHIASALRPLDLVGQLDENRLAAVCAGVHEPTTVARIAERILDVATRPIGPGGLPVIPSVGATCSPAGQRRPAVLLQSALQAADDVSGRGGGLEIV
jgi:PAS domain S-box-containing protein